MLPNLIPHEAIDQVADFFSRDRNFLLKLNSVDSPEMKFSRIIDDEGAEKKKEK